jgi:hypothetical protein
MVPALGRFAEELRMRDSGDQKNKLVSIDFICVNDGHWKA